MFISRLCEGFGALPRAGGIEDQEPELIRRMLDVRDAERALDLVDHHPEEAAKHPERLSILRLMKRAMNGESIDG